MTASSIAPVAVPPGSTARGRTGPGEGEARRVRRERLRWHCRRALLELDLVFQRFWSQPDRIDESMEAALERLLELDDHDLWHLVSGRTEATDPQLKEIIGVLRQVGMAPVLQSSD